MKVQPSSSAKQNQVFTSALSKAISVSKPQLQKALSESKPEKTSKHKRWKIVPEEGPERP
jgi:hypothetical protein